MTLYEMLILIYRAMCDYSDYAHNNNNNNNNNNVERSVAQLSAVYNTQWPCYLARVVRPLVCPIVVEVRVDP